MLRSHGFAVLGLLGMMWLARPAPLEAAAPYPLSDGLEILTRGPVHEAFAEPVVLDPRPTATVTRAPPAKIVEIVPRRRPGAEAVWIPGYWAWDDAHGEHLWVSGVWRLPPPQRRWVSGYPGRGAVRSRPALGRISKVPATRAAARPAP
jgi:hypothetical protein